LIFISGFHDHVPMTSVSWLVKGSGPATDDLIMVRNSSDLLDEHHIRSI